MNRRLLLAAAVLLAACGERPQGSSVLGAAPAASAPDATPPAAPVAAAASAPEGFFRARLAARSGGDIAFLIDGTARVEREAGAPRRYRLEGRQVLSVEWIRCTPTASPAERPLQDAWLEVDTSTTPPRYRLHAGSLWDATVSGSCPGLGSASVPMRVPGRLEASGTLDADGRARGERVDGDLRWEWSLPAP